MLIYTTNEGGRRILRAVDRARGNNGGTYQVSLSESDIAAILKAREQYAGYFIDL